MGDGTYRHFGIAETGSALTNAPGLYAPIRFEYRRSRIRPREVAPLGVRQRWPKKPATV